MAYQPHSLECRKRFEGILKEKAKVLNQKTRMREFEERERLRREKEDGNRKKKGGHETDATPSQEGNTEPVIGEESRNSGGSSSS
eukprot:9518994-Karenia_brevis.AAC.1